MSFVISTIQKFFAALCIAYICLAPVPLFAASATPPVQTGDPSDTKLIAAPLRLNIAIPGLTFDPVVEKDGYIQVSFLSKYIAAIFQYLVAISVIAAAIMIVYGGFLYVLGATVPDIAEGKSKIKDALIGLVLVFGAYGILSALNSSLVTLNTLKLESITAEKYYLEMNGTGDPIASADATARSASSGSEPSSSGSRGSSQQPTNEIPPEDRVSIKDIPFDKSLGGPANMNNYCAWGGKGTKDVTGYNAKIKLLVKAVLGWSKTCVDNKLCVYCQGCYTAIPSGQITASPLASYAMNHFIRNNVTEGLPSTIWATNETKVCNDIWNKTGEYATKGGGQFAINMHPECSAPAIDVYKNTIAAGFMDKKLFGGDCGSFAWRLYNCAGPAFQKFPTAKAYDNVKKKFVDTMYLSEKDIDKVKDLPGMIIAAHMDEDLLAMAEAKGGMKFGDMVYTCCGGTNGSYSAHWMMYTGGRPDVPFSFMDMGGGAGVAIPGLGAFSGVDHKPAGMTIQDYINTKTQGQVAKTASGKVYGRSLPTYDPKKGVVFVWRPYTED
ncbi:hypothetical protein KBC54_02435 [Patescibacteria group bacterium]|nr:hypothetical protein [Patescibacteria group bacterium]